jgi:hypothetical protein
MKIKASGLQKSQDLLVIRRNHQTGEVSLDLLRWDLIPYWCQEPKGGRRPINAFWPLIAFHDHHHRGQRISGRHPRPHAADPAARRLQPLARRRARPSRLKATVPCRVHADVADLDARQQTGERRSLHCRTDRDGYFGGVIVPPLRFWCGARRYAHLTHLDCAVGVPFLWCCYR